MFATFCYTNQKERLEIEFSEVTAIWILCMWLPLWVKIEDPRDCRFWLNMLVIYGYFSMNHPIPIPIAISPGREVLDDFLRQRAKKNGATLINGLFMGMALPEILGEPLGKHWIGSGVQLVKSKWLAGLFGKSTVGCGEVYVSRTWGFW